MLSSASKLAREAGIFDCLGEPLDRPVTLDPDGERSQVVVDRGGGVDAFHCLLDGKSSSISRLPAEEMQKAAVLLRPFGIDIGLLLAGVRTIQRDIGETKR